MGPRFNPCSRPGYTGGSIGQPFHFVLSVHKASFAAFHVLVPMSTCAKVMPYLDILLFSQPSEKKIDIKTKIKQNEKYFHNFKAFFFFLSKAHIYYVLHKGEHS